MTWLSGYACVGFTSSTLATLTTPDAFDVILHLTFSNTLGFLEAGGDVSDFMVSLDRNLDRTGLVKATDTEVVDAADNSHS